MDEHADLEILPGELVGGGDGTWGGEVGGPSCAAREGEACGRAKAGCDECAAIGPGIQHGVWNFLFGVM